jgi:hypothetical protein
MNVQYNLNDKNLKAEWKLPDGTIVKSDSIPLNSMNGGSEIVDLIIRDSAGNVVYTEKIALKSFITGSWSNQMETTLELFPNPVWDILTVDYSGHPLKSMQISVVDLSGRIKSHQTIVDVPSKFQYQLDVTSLREGVYICRMILDKEEVIVRKFIK